jgi:hypothetical protein
MAQQLINVGTVPNDGNGDPLLTWATKDNDNFTELYALQPAKTVIVNSLSDLPAPSGGAITFADNTDYFINNDLTTSDRFICGNSSVVRAPDSSVVKITYTGVGTMFSCIDGSAKLTKFKALCATGKMFEASSTSGFDVFQMIDMTVEDCATVGTVDNLQAIQISDVSWESITVAGINFLNTINVFISQNNLVVQSGGDFLDLGTATFNGFSVLNAFTFLSSGVTLLKGLASSGNIITGGLGVVTNTRITGAGAPLSGISSSDALWNFTLNDDIPDTRADALLSVSGNVAVTDIATPGQGVPVPINAVWTIDRVSQMSATTGGVATYNAGKASVLPITASATVRMDSGGAQTVTFFITINGAAIAASGASADVSSSVGARVTCIWQEQINPTDIVEFWVEGTSSTVGIVVTDTVLRVN